MYYDIQLKVNGSGVYDYSLLCIEETKVQISRNIHINFQSLS